MRQLNQKQQKHLTNINYFTVAKIAMTIIFVESEWELWEEARILFKESPNKLAYKEAKKAVMS